MVSRCARTSVVGLIALLLPLAPFARAQKVTLSRTNVGFGNHVVGKISTALNVILTNSDPATALSIDSIVASGDYSESNDCDGNVAPSSSCTLLINFQANATGRLTGTVTLTDDANNSPQLISLTGTGIQPVAVSPASLTFPTVAVGKTSAAQTVTVTNQLTAALTLGFTASADYTAAGSGTAPCGTALAAKASCTIAVTFHPTTAGTIDGALTVTQKVSTTPQLVTFSGKGSGGGKAPLSLSPANVTFGNIGVGGSYKRTVFVTNNGAGAVTISGFAASGDYTAAGGAVSPCGGGLPSGDQCSIDVTFKPTQMGAITGSLSVSDNATVKLQTVNLSGTGIAQLLVSPASLTFASQQQGVSSAPQTVRVTNQQKEALSIGSITTSGDYLTSNTCSSSLGAGASCTINVVFRPIARTGTVSGALTITSAAKSSPQVVPLSGASMGLLTRFAYTANQDSNTVSIFTVDLGSGRLRANGYAVAGTSPKAVAVAPSNKFAYVVNSGDNTIAGYSINANNGQLTPLTGLPLATDDIPDALAMTPSGQFVYVTNDGGSVSGYAVNTTTGALMAVPGSPFSAGSVCLAIAVTGKFVYAANLEDSTISAYKINASTGALSAVTGSPFATPTPYGIAVDPSGSFAYAISLTGNTVSAYQIDSSTGALKAVSGSPYATGTEPEGITVDHTGKFVFVANGGSGGVNVYSITPGTGALSAVSGSPFATPGTDPYAVTVDVTNQFLAISDPSLNDVATYSINPVSGALTFRGVAPTGSTPFSVAMAGGATPVTYQPKFAYTVTYLTGEPIAGYTIDAATGVLATMAGSPFPAGEVNNSVSVDPFGRFVYVANEGGVSGGNIPAFTIAPQTGDLTAISGSPFDVGDRPVTVTVDPSGRFAFTNHTALSAYGIDPSSGALTFLSQVPGPTGGGYGIKSAVDPAGRFLFQLGADAAGDKVYVFAINPSNGALSAVSGSPYATGTSPTWVAADSSGRFLYVVSGTDKTISAYAIDPGYGRLTPIAGSPFSTVGAYGMAIDPTGRFLYATYDVSANAGYVSGFAIDPSTGALSPILGSPFATGIDPNNVSADPSGRFLYVANIGNGSTGSDTISGYAIDPTTGALTPLTGSPFEADIQPYSLAITGVIH